jgi:hypothetical protein
MIEMDLKGQFKGVMLCSRPVAAPVVATAMDSTMGSDKAPFVSTVTPHEALGINPIAKKLPPRAKKNDMEDVTVRHKLFLAEFQEQRVELVQRMEETEKEAAERKERFQKREAERRARIREVREAGGDKEAMAKALGFQLTDELEVPAIAVAAAVAKPKKASSSKQKPKWSMTAEENEIAEEEDVDDLLEFTENLDFERYMDDLEVQEAMRFVQEKVKALEMSAPKEYEEGDEGEEGDTFATLADGDAERMLEKRGKKAKGGGGGNDGNDDAASVAESVMSDASNLSKTVLANNKAMKSLHSEASVRAIVEKQKASLAMAEPVESTVKAKGPNAMDIAQNLPYLNRSPHI